MTLLHGPGSKVNAVIFLTTTIEGNLRLLFPPFLTSLGFPVSAVGYFFSLLAMAALVSRLPGGFFCALKHRRTILCLALSVMGVTSLFYAFHPPPELIVIFLAGHGLAFGLATTMLLALCIDTIQDRQKTPVTIGWFTAFISAGYAAGNFMAGQMANHFGIPLAFACPLFFAGVAIILLLTIPWPVREGETQSARVLAIGALEKGFLERMCVVAKIILKFPLGVYVAVLLVFYINFINQIVDTYFPLLAMKNGLNLALVGTLQGVKSTSATVIRFFLGIILQKISYRLANNICLFSVATGVTFLAGVSSVPVLVGMFMAMGIGRGVIRGTSAIFVAESRFDSAVKKGLASGVYNGGLDLGDILGPLIAALAIRFLGLNGIFGVLPGCLLLPCLLFMFWSARSTVSTGEVKEK